MIARQAAAALANAMGRSPTVALLGPRQVGKTTLAREVARGRDAVYLDIESDSAKAPLSEPEMQLSAQRGRLVILDEVHRSRGLFPVLRGQIDAARREGLNSGQYLLLGSASLDLVRQSGGTLAERIAYRELTPSAELAPSA